MIALRSPGVQTMPGLPALDFFTAWLADGCGGTCWPTSNALWALLVDLGFESPPETSEAPVWVLEASDVQACLPARPPWAHKGTAGHVLLIAGSPGKTGAAALAGTSFPIRRELVAKALGFDGVCGNSLDAVSDRDFAIEFTACGAMLMVHLSRFCEELILWMSQSFGFIDLADRFCTGSSIMPQKKNPDVPELARGKTGRVVGHLMGLITLMKGQPLAYNKDNQEDKEPLFDTVDTLTASLRVFADMVGGIKVNADNMRKAALEGFATATDLADYLVKKGLPFREAHEAVAQAVKFADGRGCDLADLKLDELQQFSSLIDKDVFTALTLEGSLKARSHIGGTAPARVKAAIAKARKAVS